MKYSQWIGITAALILVIACFFPWTYHPDLDKTFTGFFSENNVYGRPGRVFIVLSIVSIVFFLIRRVWAKRWNLLVSAIILAFAIKSFIMYSGCYRGICPEKQAGLFIMLFSAIILLVMSFLPDLRLKSNESK